MDAFHRKALLIMVGLFAVGTVAYEYAGRQFHQEEPAEQERGRSLLRGPALHGTEIVPSRPSILAAELTQVPAVIPDGRLGYISDLSLRRRLGFEQGERVAWRSLLAPTSR